MLKYFLKGWLVVISTVALIAGLLIGSYLLFELWHPALFIEAGVILAFCISLLIGTSYEDWQDK